MVNAVSMKKIILIILLFYSSYIFAQQEDSSLERTNKVFLSFGYKYNVDTNLNKVLNLAERGEINRNSISVGIGKR